MDIFVAQPLPHDFTVAAAAMPSSFGDGSLRAYGEIDYGKEFDSYARV
jgi:hypothetical protein